MKMPTRPPSLSQWKEYIGITQQLLSDVKKLKVLEADEDGIEHLTYGDYRADPALSVRFAEALAFVVVTVGIDKVGEVLQISKTSAGQWLNHENHSPVRLRVIESATALMCDWALKNCPQQTTILIADNDQ